MSRLRSQSTAVPPGAAVRSMSAPTGKPRSNTQCSSTPPELSSLTLQEPSSSAASVSDIDHDLTTIPDPRGRSATPDMDGSPTHQQHPELSDEVATLSTKLVRAINHQTALDDELSDTRAELDRARAQISSMEIQIEKQREMLDGDIWIRRKSAEAEKSKLLHRISEEKKLREEAEQEKKRIEQELENLTTELFEEANNMVISAKEDARREQDIVLRKNDLLKAQLADTEGLLKSQQEQLVELKQVMEQMNADRDDRTATTTPSSPGYSKFDTRDDDTPTSEIGSQSGLSDLVAPSYPTSFTHLLQPVLRSDISAYQDFANLCESSRRVGSRPPSGTVSTLGLGLMGSTASITSVGIPSSVSTASLSSVGSPAASSTYSPQPPNTPASSYSGTQALPIPPLKETKFYKRVLAEDIEPTLRLDIAPGLSWLARRSVITAMSEGSLVVEPVPTTGTYALLSKPQFYPCSLCGENRKDDEYLRRYRFRTSENSSSQRYPLCRYCLNRVRATCDFLGFLRIVKDGHWRTDDDDSEKAAWEESVRLRENMFWARIGGGVRPIMHGFHGHSHSVMDKSPRPSRDEGTRSPELATESVIENQAGEENDHDNDETAPVISDDDYVEEFATPSEDLTPAASSAAIPAVTDELQAAAEVKPSVEIVEAPAHDEEDVVQEEEVREIKQVPTPPRTPSPSRNHRLSTQSLTPKSHESNKKISLNIPDLS
ncbi:hypothetical protein BD289DRAFT_261945 [Coniella lustricola]|uniref:GDP/GTP exchange factor Sec2 N-terminal domain-containing protein n=1 Tax=Coniella lustricola TaxID=2025994 RepID=A0A2T3A7X4_9PEZI|nr:hypothetical protein BD289DRAFT_261945 [Coniella lustricola]